MPLATPVRHAQSVGYHYQAGKGAAPHTAGAFEPNQAFCITLTQNNSLRKSCLHLSGSSLDSIPSMERSEVGLR